MGLLSMIKQYEINRIRKKQEEEMRKKREEETVDYLKNLNLNFDPQELYDFRDRCVLLGVDECIDDFINISKSGEIFSFFEIYVAYALVHKLDVLKIPEGIEILLVNDLEYNYAGTLIFPKTLKTISTQKFISDDDSNYAWNYDIGSITMEFKDTEKRFGILDFSKCEQLTQINMYGFSHMNIKELLLPKTVTKLNNYSFCKCNIEKLELPGNLSLGKKVFNSNIKQLSYGKFINVSYESLEGSNIPELRTLVIPSDGIIEEYSLGENIKTLYLPILKTHFKETLTNYVKLFEETIGKNHRQFNDNEWHDCLNIYAEYINNFVYTGKNEKYYIHSQSPIMTIDTDTLYQIIDKKGKLLGLATLFYLDAQIGDETDFINCLFKYLSVLWDINLKDDKKQYTIILYDGDNAMNVFNRNYILQGIEYVDKSRNFYLSIEDSLVEDVKRRLK